MNLQRPAKANRRFAKFVERHVAETLTRGGAEMISVPRQGLLAVGDRAGKVAAHEAARWRVYSSLRQTRI